MIQVAVAHQSRLPAVDPAKVRAAIELVLQNAGIETATISVAVVDGAEMRELNARYLNHDWPTDVLSFVLDASDESIDGEVIVSAETALSASAEHGTTPVEEFLLYVVHGTLHLVGHDDHDDASAAEMRRLEQLILSQLNLAN
jgi:probable rRNA maturation factor